MMATVVAIVEKDFAVFFFYVHSALLIMIIIASLWAQIESRTE